MLRFFDRFRKRMMGIIYGPGLTLSGPGFFVNCGKRFPRMGKSFCDFSGFYMTQLFIKKIFTQGPPGGPGGSRNSPPGGQAPPPPRRKYAYRTCNIDCLLHLTPLWCVIYTGRFGPASANNFRDMKGKVSKMSKFWYFCIPTCPKRPPTKRVMA